MAASLATRPTAPAASAIVVGARSARGMCSRAISTFLVDLNVSSYTIVPELLEL